MDVPLPRTLYRTEGMCLRRGGILILQFICDLQLHDCNPPRAIM